MKSKTRLTAGITLVELLTASAISTMVLTILVSTLIMGSSSWMRGLGKIQAEGNSQMAIKRVTDELREAMSVQVDSSGSSASYRVPAKDSKGDFIYPLVWDKVNRKISLVGTDLVMFDGPTKVNLARGVLPIDPIDPQKRAYQIFTPGPGTLTRQVTVQVATTANSYKNENSTSRSRETIFLRNVPQYTR